MRNLRTLEQEGMVNSKNDYQEVINAIAKVRPGGGGGGREGSVRKEENCRGAPHPFLSEAKYICCGQKKHKYTLISKPSHTPPPPPLLFNFFSG